MGFHFFLQSLIGLRIQLNFITERLEVQLGIKRQRSQIEISGIAEINTEVHYFIISTIIKSRNLAFSTELKFYIIPRISERHPELDFDISRWSLPPNLTLADPSFHKP